MKELLAELVKFFYTQLYLVINFILSLIYFNFTNTRVYFYYPLKVLIRLEAKMDGWFWK